VEGGGGGKLADPARAPAPAYNPGRHPARIKPMPTRDLYLAAYDVTDSDRLQAALHVLKGYASGGQKSVFECFLTARERRALLEEVRGVLDTREDRFLLLPLPGHRNIRGLGIAVPPSDPEFYYVG
jgi:CRISPR-associated protein Cas2